MEITSQYVIMVYRIAILPFLYIVFYFLLKLLILYLTFFLFKYILYPYIIIRLGKSYLTYQREYSFMVKVTLASIILFTAYITANTLAITIEANFITLIGTQAAFIYTANLALLFPRSFSIAINSLHLSLQIY